jgi:PadR family transcriptional regulator, regulatory protein PadR
LLKNKNNEPRVTLQVIKVLQMFLDNPCNQISGYEIIKATQLSSGTAYPLLIRLEKAGWLESEWENIVPTEVGRPRRRLYKITNTGLTRINYELTNLINLSLAII